MMTRISSAALAATIALALFGLDYEPAKAQAMKNQAMKNDGPAGQPTGKPDYILGDLQIRVPWTRATPKGAPVAGGYVTITNTGKAPDRLTNGSFALSERFEIHEMTMAGGVMKMRHLPGGIEIKPGATLVLKPGSYHLMFMKLKGQMVPGKPVQGSLVFEKAGKVDIIFAVAPMGSTRPPAKKH